MAAYQYVYHMQGVSKTYTGGKKCFENIQPVPYPHLTHPTNSKVAI